MKAVVKALLNQLGQKSTSAQQDVELERLRRFAFMDTKSFGDADNKFTEYLQRCYLRYPSFGVTAPYVTVVQSSGFDKSRLRYDLALEAFGGSKGSVQSLDIKALLTCVMQPFSNCRVRLTIIGILFFLL